MAEEKTNFSQELNDSGFSKEFGGKYSGSELQEQTYVNLQKKDAQYTQFIADNYGSYENYINMNRIGLKSSEFDPTIDFVMDVTITTKDKSYKTDHISTQEVILEAMSGICTIIFVKVNGSVGKITGTLDADYIPPTQTENRINFFRPLSNNRVVMWDITKQGWRSFYMDNVIKFVRDDTTDLE